MKHWHIELDGPKATNFADPDLMSRISNNIQELHQYLQNNEERALLHCAAGMHRTGMVSYTILRLSGLDPDTAYKSLAKMRRITYEEVGEWRIQMAEDKWVPK